MTVISYILARMLKILAKLSNILILDNENQEIFFLFAVVVLFKLKKPITIQARMPVIYAPVFQKFTRKVLQPAPPTPVFVEVVETMIY